MVNEKFPNQSGAPERLRDLAGRSLTPPMKPKDQPSQAPRQLSQSEQQARDRIAGGSDYKEVAETPKEKGVANAVNALGENAKDFNEK